MIRLAAGRRWTIAVALWLAMPATAQPTPAPGPVVVVLPFENVAEAVRLNWLKEGAAILLTDALTAGHAVVVGRDERLVAFERLQLPASAALSRASEIKVGQVLGATSVVIGRFETTDEGIVVSARRIGVDAGTLGPAVTSSGPMAELLSVFDRLARQLDGSALGASTATGDRPPSPQVFELYVRGITSESAPGAVALLERVVTAAPQYERGRVALWRAATDAGDHQRAADVIARLRTESPRFREARFLNALSLIALKRFDEALQSLHALLDGGNVASVANAIGVIELRHAPIVRAGRATYYFSQAKDADPEDGDLFFNLGYAYYLERDMKAAVYWLREAVRRNPGDGAAHGVLSAALQQRGAPAEAARERELADRLLASFASWEARPSSGGDRVPRGLERLRVQFVRTPAAADVLVSSAEQRDQASLAQFHLEAGRRAFERQDDRAAIQSLRRALYLSPYLADAHLLLGRVFLRGGRVDEAIETLKIAIWSDDTASAHVTLAEAFLRVNDRNAAQAEIDRALAIDATSVDALRLKAKLGGAPW